MPDNDSKKSNPKKLRLIPNSEVREIITATHEAINKVGTRTKVADTILKLSHAYIDLSGAYKDVKKELSALYHTHGSRNALMKELLDEMQGKMQGAAESVVEQEQEICELRNKLSVMERANQDLRKQNDRLSKMKILNRRLEKVTSGELKTRKEEEFIADRRELFMTIPPTKKDEETARKIIEAKEASKLVKPVKHSIKHSSQAWRAAKPHRDQRRKIDVLKERIEDKEILEILGE